MQLTATRTGKVQKCFSEKASKAVHGAWLFCVLIQLANFIVIFRCFIVRFFGS